MHDETDKELELRNQRVEIRNKVDPNKEGLREEIEQIKLEKDELREQIKLDKDLNGEFNSSSSEDE